MRARKVNILSFTECLHGVSTVLMVLYILLHAVVTVTFGVSSISLRAVKRVIK